MRKSIDKKLEKNSVFPGKIFSRVVLTGSNAEALYSVYKDHFSISGQSLRTMERKKLKKLIKYLVSSEDRALILIRNVPEKVHMIIPAAVLAEEIAAIYNAEELIVSDKGVKDGYLRLLMEESNG